MTKKFYVLEQLLFNYRVFATTNEDQRAPSGIRRWPRERLWWVFYSTEDIVIPVLRAETVIPVLFLKIEFQMTPLVYTVPG